VEEDDAVFPRYQDVRRLDVPMQLARLMDGCDPLGELEQGVAQPAATLRREGRGRGGRGGGGRAGSVPAPGALGERVVHSRRQAQLEAGDARARPGALADIAEEVHPVDELHGDVPATAVG